MHASNNNVALTLSGVTIGCLKYAYYIYTNYNIYIQAKYERHINKTTDVLRMRTVAVRDARHLTLSFHLTLLKIRIA